MIDRDTEEASSRYSSRSVVSSSRVAPPYGHRKGWIPRSVEDFGDGGAYPEVHVAQYPLGMGKKKGTSNALAVAVDATGKIKYDAIARQGHSQDKVIYSKYKDLVPKQFDEDDPELEKPDEEAIQENTEKTKNALEALVQSKIAAAMPVRAADKQAPAQYIRYTPSQQGAAFNSGAKQRIIRMVEVQKDPMEPPRFKYVLIVVSPNDLIARLFFSCCRSYKIFTFLTFQNKQKDPPRATFTTSSSHALTQSKGLYDTPFSTLDHET